MSARRPPLAPTLFAVALIGGGCASAGSLSPRLPTSGDRFFVSGYHSYWTGEAWRSYPWDDLDELYWFELEVDATGVISEPHGWPAAAAPVLERAAREGVSVVPTVSMHDAAAFTELFSDPARVARLVEGMLALPSATPGLGGIHLDFEVFEPVPPSARDGYTAFVARLERRLREGHPSLSLSSFALAFDDDDAYNERALAELVDFLVVQGYDLHHLSDQRAGPVAPLQGWGRLNWEAVVDRLIALGVPPRKIVMGVPLYGYEWPVTSAEPGAATTGAGVTAPLAPPADVEPQLPRALAQAERHGVLRDAESDTPYYVYRDASGWRQGWFEDEESLRAKYAFVRARGLGGVALFPLAYADQRFWSGLGEAFSRPRD